MKLAPSKYAERRTRILRTATAAQATAQTAADALQRFQEHLPNWTVGQIRGNAQLFRTAADELRNAANMMLADANSILADMLQ